MSGVNRFHTHLKNFKIMFMIYWQLITTVWSAILKFKVKTGQKSLIFSNSGVDLFYIITQKFNLQVQIKCTHCTRKKKFLENNGR